MLERRGGSVEMLPPGLNQVRLSWARPRHPRRSYVDRSLCQGARAPSVYALALQSGSRFDSPSLSRSISAGGDVINSLLFSPFHLFLSLMLMIDWLCILLYLMKNNLFCTSDTWLMFLLVCFCLKLFSIFFSFRVNSNECTFIVQIFSGNQTMFFVILLTFHVFHNTEKLIPILFSRPVCVTVWEMGVVEKRHYPAHPWVSHLCNSALVNWRSCGKKGQVFFLNWGFQWGTPPDPNDDTRPCIK